MTEEKANRFRFRSWIAANPPGEKMLYFELSEDTRIQWLPELNQVKMFESGDIYGPMQSTGLCDKNGKEIFESDIVRCIWECSDRTSDKVVEWKNDRWTPLHNCAGLACVISTEIIGNIYENPELVK